MILRKPYAFLIKRFKLIHFILSALLIFVIYRITNILSFFNEYMDMSPTIISKNVAPTLYSASMIISLVLLILFSIVIMCLMFFKQKNVTFYALFILICLMTGGYLYYSYGIVEVLEKGLVAVKTLRFVRDLSFITVSVQFIFLIVLVVRTIGFNIKKFDFGREMLKVNDEDREEFEFDVSFDSDKFKRNLKRNFRNFKYIYKENKLFINLGISLFIAIICAIVYLNVNIYNKKYRENEYINVDGITFGVVNSYITNYDYKSNLLDNSLIAIEFKVKSKTIQNFELSDISLDIGNRTYLVDSNYANKVVALGILYTNQTLENEFKKYIIVFKVDNKTDDEEFLLSYHSTSNKHVNVKLNPINIDKQNIIKNSNLGEEVDFSSSLLNKSSLILNSYEISDKFRVDYNFCIENNCIPSYEYLTKTVTGNYDKTILKLDYKFNMDENNINNINSFYDLLFNYSKIIYEINGETKQLSVSTNIKPIKTNLKNTIYVEVNQELKNADSIIIQFKIRQYVYEYKIK